MNFEVGFSQWATINAGLTLSKYDGYKTQQPTNYDALLDDASQIPVILYDTTQKRATQHNAEDLILQILLHKQQKGTFAANTTTNPVQMIQGAVPDRRIRSTRKAMKVNAERVLCFRTQLGQPGEKAVVFKDEVERLQIILDALWDKTSPESSGIEISKMSLSPHQIIAWEYMTFVNSPSVKYLSPRSVRLGLSNGGWQRYAQDIRALNILGSNFGNLLQAANLDDLCSTCVEVPRGICSLAVRTSVLAKLFEEQGCLQDRARLTDNGWNLQAIDDPFKPCHKDCRGFRMVALVQQPPRGNFRFTYRLPTNGVVVIGKSGFSLLKLFRYILRSGVKTAWESKMDSIAVQSDGRVQ